MHGYIPKPINPQGELSGIGLRSLAAAAAQFGLSGGINDTVGSQGITAKPQVLDACFAIVDDYEDNRHAWTEADLSDPDNPKRMTGGRRGTITTHGSGSGVSGVNDQTGYDFNGGSHEAGTVVFVWRTSYNAWGLICCADLSGSGSGPISVYCDGHLSGHISVSGNSVSVTTT